MDGLYKGGENIAVAPLTYLYPIRTEKTGEMFYGLLTIFSKIAADILSRFNSQ